MEDVQTMNDNKGCECLHGGGGPQVVEVNRLFRWGNPSVHIVSHFNLITFT